jgi:hypothetical protein
MTSTCESQGSAEIVIRDVAGAVRLEIEFAELPERRGVSDTAAAASPASSVARSRRLKRLALADGLLGPRPGTHDALWTRNRPWAAVGPLGRTRRAP